MSVFEMLYLLSQFMLVIIGIMDLYIRNSRSYSGKVNGYFLVSILPGRVSTHLSGGPVKIIIRLPV